MLARAAMTTLFLTTPCVRPGDFAGALCEITETVPISAVSLTLDVTRPSFCAAGVQPVVDRYEQYRRL